MSAPDGKMAAKLPFVREHLVVASDRLCALAAYLRDQGLDDVEDGQVIGQVLDAMLAIWTIRWELGVMPGNVQESDEQRRTAEQNRELSAAREAAGGRR